MERIQEAIAKAKAERRGNIGHSPVVGPFSDREKTEIVENSP